MRWSMVETVMVSLVSPQIARKTFTRGQYCQRSSATFPQVRGQAPCTVNGYQLCVWTSTCRRCPRRPERLWPFRVWRGNRDGTTVQGARDDRRGGDDMRSAAASTVGAVALLLGGMAGPAQAGAPVDPVDHYSGEFAHEDKDCGLNLHFDVTFSGRYSAQPAPGSDEAFLGHDRYWFSETITLAGVEGSPSVTTAGSG